MAMKLQIKAVGAPGKIEEERLVIKALADTDIGAYVLLQAGFNTEQKVLNVATYHAFWFPYQEIKSGDLILRSLFKTPIGPLCGGIKYLGVKRFS